MGELQSALLLKKQLAGNNVVESMLLSVTIVGCVEIRLTKGSHNGGRRRPHDLRKKCFINAVCLIISRRRNVYSNNFYLTLNCRAE